MLDWIHRRFLTVHDLGRYHGKRGLPRADAAIAMPLHGEEQVADYATTRQRATDAFACFPQEPAAPLRRAGAAQ